MLKNPLTLIVLGVLGFVAWKFWESRNKGASEADPHNDSSSKNAPTGTPAPTAFETITGELSSIFGSIKNIAGTVPRNN